MPDELEQTSTYQSLYRRFRPQRFGAVLGQDHVALALRNAVRESRVGHAYLFSGPRGTGKTSTARILGKALNCTDLEDGEPCGKCDSCRSVAAGTSFDVHELDAASNNGVDAMRDLVARSALATPGRWKVYIVDEVHMLSTPASNALLKTLEEPPDHVVFVLATTESQKVLPTIRSRTQHFEFHLLGDDVLAGLLDGVASAAALDLPDGALSQAVRRGRGSARDALSVLDQVAASGMLEEDTDTWLGRGIAALAENDESGLLLALEDAVRAGRDPQQLALDLVDRLRLGFLSLVTNGSLDHEHALEEDELTSLRSMGRARLVRALETVGQAIVSMRDAPDPRVTLEVALLRVVRPEDESTYEALLERIERLERRVAELGDDSHRPAAPASPQTSPATASSQPSMAAAPPAVRAAPPAAPAAPPSSAAAGGRPALGAFLADRRLEDVPSSPAPPEEAHAPAAAEMRKEPAATSAPAVAPPGRDELVAAWGDHVITSLRPKVRAIYQAGRFVSTEGGESLFALPNEAHITHAEPLRSEVDAALSAHFGRPVSIRLVPEASAGAAGGDSSPEPATSDDPPAGPRGGTPLPPALEEPEDFGTIDDGPEPDSGGGVGLAWAENRLLQAFPGAEEV